MGNGLDGAKSMDRDEYLCSATDPSWLSSYLGPQCRCNTGLREEHSSGRCKRPVGTIRRGELEAAPNPRRLQYLHGLSREGLTHLLCFSWQTSQAARVENDSIQSLARRSFQLVYSLVL